MTKPRFVISPHGSVRIVVLVFCWAGGAFAADTTSALPKEEVPPGQPRQAESPVLPVVSTVEFEAALYASLVFAGLAIPNVGSLNPLGASAYAAMRYVPVDFPFHAYLETGGGLFATGTTTGPSGTEYDNLLTAWFLSPGVGLDLGSFRVTVGLGPALVVTNRSTTSEDTTTTSVAVAADAGVSYRFFESRPWALSAALRYQTIPGAKLDALSLGLRFRFGSIAYR